MTPFSLQPKVEVLYRKFSNEPYVPREYWSTEREFKLDPLYQHTATQYVSDARFEKQQHEFVLDTSLLGGSRRDRTAHT
jgi:hypothetical protein